VWTGDQKVVFAGQRAVEKGEVVRGGKKLDRPPQLDLQILAQGLMRFEQRQRRIEGHDAQTKRTGLHSFRQQAPREGQNA